MQTIRGFQTLLTPSRSLIVSAALCCILSSAIQAAPQAGKPSSTSSRRTQTRLQLSSENAAALGKSKGVTRAMFETTSGRIAPQKKKLILNGSSRRPRQVSNTPTRISSDSKAKELKASTSGKQINSDSVALPNETPEPNPQLLPVPRKQVPSAEKSSRSTETQNRATQLWRNKQTKSYPPLRDPSDDSDQGNLAATVQEPIEVPKGKTLANEPAKAEPLEKSFSNEPVALETIPEIRAGVPESEDSNALQLEPAENEANENADDAAKEKPLPNEMAPAKTKETDPAESAANEKADGNELSLESFENPVPNSDPENGLSLGDPDVPEESTDLSLSDDQPAAKKDNDSRSDSKSGEDSKEASSGTDVSTMPLENVIPKRETTQNIAPAVKGETASVENSETYNALTKSSRQGATLPEPVKIGSIGDSEEAECPGAPSKDSKLVSDPDDIPLESQPHPYDAPKAGTNDEPDAVASASDYSPRELRMQRGINETLAYFMEHPETVVRRGPWALMHASLPFGVESEVIAGNRRVNTLGWMCFNGNCARQRMFQPTKRGFRPNVGPGVQGHDGQFLAILAQSRVQSDYPIKIGSRQYTIEDLVKYEMATCREHSELTFKLIGLSYYLEADATWRDNRGRKWNLEKMVADELSQPINGVACGGSHRLMGLSYALIERKRAGLPITGAWARAEKYLNDYVNYTMTLQNPDGSFSTNWFEGRGNKPDMERKVQTTGHMLEWLIYTLPDDHLRSERIQISIEYLLDSVGKKPSYDWPIGPRGHALRALALYNQRVFGAEQGQLKQHIALLRDEGVIR